MISSNVCSIHRRGREESWGVPCLQRVHYWLFLCSVRLIDASAEASPRAALERKSTHLAWSSSSWALKSKVCWVLLSRIMCLTSVFSAAAEGAGLTSNPGRGTGRDPFESCKKIVKNEYKTCQSEKNCISKLVSLGQAFLWGKRTILEIMKMTACLFSCKIFQQACTVNPALLSPSPLFLSV